MFTVILLIITGVFLLTAKPFSELLFRIVVGFMLIFLMNGISMSLFGESVGVNLVTASVFGVLGLPGYALLILSVIFL